MDAAVVDALGADVICAAALGAGGDAAGAAALPLRPPPPTAPAGHSQVRITPLEPHFFAFATTPALAAAEVLRGVDAGALAAGEAARRAAWLLPRDVSATAAARFAPRFVTAWAEWHALWEGSGVAAADGSAGGAGAASAGAADAGGRGVAGAAGAGAAAAAAAPQPAAASRTPSGMFAYLLERMVLGVARGR